MSATLPPGGPAAARPVHVLVVDDHEPNLTLAAVVLEADGMVVGRARDAAAARNYLREQRPDLVLMDIQMPGTDGLTLTREIRADPQLQGLRIIAFTAYAMRGDEANFLASGCDGYLAKPIEVARFAAQVRAFLPA